ncbi:MAG: aminopeptidase P family protein [Negativicutes bacterium]|nr:aminopeptidase P family protein [Negativicutes bacterium]
MHAKISEFLQSHELDAVVVSKQENRQYLSGFTGSAGILFITRQNRYLVTDFRYIEQAQNQAPAFEIVRCAGIPIKTLTEVKASLSGIKRVGFETDHVTWESYQTLAAALPGVELVAIKLDTLRAVKTAVEIDRIERAVEIADRAFGEVIKSVRPGVRETDIAAELEYIMRQLGSERPAFDTIVASGERSALPHGRASAKIIAPGDFITFDFGAVFEGYHSDMTRTVVLGKASAKQREIYELVLRAQLAGLDAVQSGKDCRDVDAVARKIIEDAGYGEYFGHGLGHSVGLAIHEEPRLSPTNVGVLLAENMVVTVEPGVYLPGWGGVRIEDIVVVTAGKPRILTATSKNLLELY